VLGDSEVTLRAMVRLPGRIAATSGDRVEGRAPTPDERILLLAPSSGLGGGIERYVSEVEQALQRRGVPVWRVDLYRPSQLGLTRRLRFVWEAASAFARLRPSHVFIMHEDLFTMAGTLARLAMSVSIGWIYGAEVFWEPGRSQTRRAARHVDQLATISEFTADQLRSCLSTALRVPIIKPALGSRWWDLLDEVDAPRAERPRLVAVSRMDSAAKSKGVWTVVEVTAALQGEFPGLECHVVGGGDALDDYRRRVSHRGYDGFCRLLGSIPDHELIRELKQAWIFVLPSRLELPSGEGFGIVYLEAASAGLPVVGSTEGGAREAVVDGVTGLAVDPRDVAGIQEACRCLLRDPQLRRRMGEEGASWARTGFTPERFDREIGMLLDACRKRRRKFGPIFR
jgi:phosphatidylinositol alpha-1,6-mannosyltransferase